MLQFNEQYNVLHGIFITFDKNTKSRLLKSTHKQDVRDRAKSMYSYKKYETWTKENLVVLGLYIMLRQKPSSFSGLLKELNNDDTKIWVSEFKDKIINYKSYIIQDINFILETTGEKPTTNKMFDLYADESIQFYTLWWFLKFSGVDLDELMKTRVKGTLLKRIRQINLFLTYKESNLEYIKKALVDKLNLSVDI